jgi:threonine synthase
MDVGDPNNWVRIMDLFGGNMVELKKVLTAYSYTDEETLDAIKQVHAGYGYIMCPHTAIAYLAVKKWKSDNPEDTSSAIFLSTAHPCKFPDVFPEEIYQEIEIPPQVKDLEDKMQIRISLGNDFESFKRYLLG